MPFRLDRTAFHAGTYEQNARYHAQPPPATPAEQLWAAAYLNSVAFGYDPANLPQLDRTVFSMRPHAHRNNTVDQHTQKNQYSGFVNRTPSCLN